MNPGFVLIVNFSYCVAILCGGVCERERKKRLGQSLGLVVFLRFRKLGT